MSDADTPNGGSAPIHHLAAVWFADLVGYTALSETNEGEAIRAVSRFQAVVRAVVQTHGGRVVKFLGDGALAEFLSTEHAVRSADALRADFARVAEAEGLGARELRIGVHVGDVATSEDGDLYGDGVNVASRIQAAADPGEVWVSEDVRRQLRQRPELRFASRGERTLKGLRTPLVLHAVGVGGSAPAETSPRAGSKAPREASIRRRALSLAGIGAVVAIVLIGGSQFLGRGGGDVAEASVAVLPFENVSGDSGNEYFADGMTEEILNALAQVPDLRVAARTSSFAYKGRDVDIREVARDLGVATVLEGSVRREGDDLRITAQLIDARNGFHLWSETYDRKLESVFAIQEEIAEAIAGELKGSLGLTSGDRLVRNRTGDMGAYQLYLEAGSHLARRGDGVERAVALYEQALERDPTFAPAWAGLAEAWTLAPYYRAGSDSAYWFGALAHAEETAAKALEFDPSLVTAHVALGSLHRDRWEWVAAERAFRHALELAPEDPEANQQYGEMLASMGRNEEALPYARRATELDPLAAIRFQVLGYILHNDGQREASRQALERALALDPTLPWPVNDLVRHYVTGGQYSEADRFLARIDVDAEDPKRRALRALAADNSALAASIVQGDDDLRNDPFLQMAIGNREDALVALDRGVLEGVPFGMTETLWDPYFDPLRSDPRFETILRRRNLEPR